MTDQTADVLVAEARRAVHESLTFLAAPEADRVRALIADLETAVESRTAIRLSDAADTAPAAGRAGLRDHIRRAVCEAEGFVWDTDMLEPDEYGEIADAVLAVLPGQQAALTDSERTMLTYALDQAQERIWSEDGFTDEDQAAVDSLRRMAAGAQQQETEAHPPQHAWRVETRDPLADQWAPGSHFASRPHAVQRYETANRNAPLWKDGTPVERRIVRETTTYTVEQAAPLAPQTAVGSEEETDVVAPHCPGFPTTCPNPVIVPPAPPYHDGGFRCGCYDAP